MSNHSGSKSRKTRPQQLEVRWPETESFALTMQSAIDGDRVAREAAQRAADRAKCDLLQAQLLPKPIHSIENNS